MWPFGRQKVQETSRSEDLLRRRVVSIYGFITDKLAQDVIARLLFLQYEGSRKPLTLRIESPGGSFQAGLAVVDTAWSLKSPVRTEAPLFAHGIAAVILASGRKG
jgi:ATP-dependent Clp protease protease subunit